MIPSTVVGSKGARFILESVSIKRDEESGNYALDAKYISVIRRQEVRAIAHGALDDVLDNLEKQVKQIGELL